MKREIFTHLSRRTNHSVRVSFRFAPLKPAMIFSLCLTLLLSGLQGAVAQTPVNTTIPAGSFIINMGIMPQTVANGLKPYGLIYALLQAKCPVEWVINPDKLKDGTDFTYNGVAYKGGTFIIKSEFRTAAVNNLIATWTNPAGLYKVVGVTTTSPISVPVYLTMWNAPKWTMDKQNGGIATGFFVNAGIPASAYGGSSSTLWKIPADLTCCDDIFVMPHADPIWLTHRRLYDWVGSGTSGCKGGVWLGCHAGSALENMFDNLTTDSDPIDRTQQTNFLVDVSAPAVGAGPWSTPGNSLILWGSHDDGTLPYSFNNTYATDPVAQYMGSTDAAQLNGSEQIYIPAHASDGWWPATRVLVYDSDHPQAKSWPNTPMTHVGSVMAYGPGFGVTGNGKVMLEAAHNIGGTAPANVAAQRAFFNYSFLVAWEKAVLPTLSNLPETVYSGQSYELSYGQEANVPPAPPQNYTTVWSASCGGTFLPDNTSATVTYIPPTAATPTLCNISVTITDECGRTSFDTHSVMIQCNLQATTSITNPCFNTPNGGAIALSFTGGSGPFSYTWTRAEGGSGSGTLNTAPYIITGLAAGTYTVTATANSGNGCPVTTTVGLTQSPEIIIQATPVAVACFGGSTGSINTSITGGIPGYTYAWTGPNGFTSTLQNLSGLTIGNYNLTVTDSKGCTQTTSATVTQPSAISITPTIVDVSCFGGNTGSIALSVSGGTSPYTYLWNDGNSSQNRTGLAAGTYSVTVTDVNNCALTYSNILVSQPASALSLSETHVNVLCYGNSTGSVNLSVTGGTSPYTYAWTGPGGFSSGLEDISNLAAGTYNVNVTDNKGCIATLSVTITQVPAMVLSAVVTNPTCPPVAPVNNSDGAINLTVTNGTPGYTFSWTGPNSFTSTSEDISGLIAGTYDVTVTDSQGCIKSASVTLTYLNPILPPPGTISK